MKRILIWSAAIVAIVTGAILTGANYLIGYALTPQIAQKTDSEAYETLYADYPHLKPWVDSLRLHNALGDTTILSDHDQRLHALYVAAPQSTPRTAIIIHGYTSHSVDMLMIGYMYNRVMGYNILLPDLVYHGKSEGAAIQMGWKDREDIMRWIGVAEQMWGTTEPTKVVVHGISMGAATAMMLSGEVLPPQVRCFVEDCGYTSVWDQFKKELHEDFALPSWPLLNVASWLCKVRYGWDFHEASAVEAVSRCHRPMLFIHGDKDKYVPTQMVEDLYRAKPAPKKLWIVADAAHAVSYRDNSEEYTRRVREFVEACIEYDLPLRKKSTSDIVAHPQKAMRLHGAMREKKQ